MGFLERMGNRLIAQTTAEEEDTTPLLHFDILFWDLLENEIKTSTIRRGLDKRLLKPDTTFKTNNPFGGLYKIIKVNRIRFDEIDDEIAYKEGYRAASLLTAELQRIYDNELKEDQLLYQVEFQKI